MLLQASLFLAQVRAPLFGNQWLALAAVLAGVAVFMALVVVAGRWLAATHPDAPPRPVVATPVAPPSDEIPAAVLAIIAAAVEVTVGPRARIAAVLPVPAPTPSVEMLMQQWSIEGRRQIYSSHQIR